MVLVYVENLWLHKKWCGIMVAAGKAEVPVIQLGK